ncbi:hypothetical protein [Phaeodactylibacter xiamenensis]|uniref:hypothetical protein n=1 Tax=Phaeodactylibacter xiamenensis TaxID=1524460 RepID=UPI003CCBA121
MQKHRATHSCTSFTVFPGTFFSKRLGQLVLLAALFIVPFLTSAQSWDTVRIVDFSNPSFNPNLSGVQGFNAVGFTLGNNGASGNFNDLCAFTSSFSAQDRIAMRVSLLAGVDYRVSLNGKVNRAGQAVNFAYAPASNPQQVTVISQSITLADIDYNDPGATMESNTFAVAANGNYWVVAEHGGVNLPNVFARLDNFRVEALEEAPMPSLSLTDNDGTPITGGIEAEPGTPFMLCLSPDSAPAGDMALELGIDGDGSPHFSDFTTMPLTFQAGSTDNVCFELSPSAEAVAGTYTFQLTDGNGEEVMSFGVGVEPPCTSVAGPDWNVCEGVSVQLGTGCLPAPHPLDGVDYCYAWVPADGLDDPASAMPNATPSETTTYTVYVTTSEGELIVEEEVVVSVIMFDASIVPINPVICSGIGELSSSDSAPDLSYNWSTGETTESIFITQPDSYGLTVTNSTTGCTSVSEVDAIDGENPNEIEEFFLNEEGYVQFDIEVLDEISLKQNDSSATGRQFFNDLVIDYANLTIHWEGEDMYPKQFLFLDIDRAMLDVNNAKAYITKNTNLCSDLDNNIGSQILSGFDLQDQDYGVHMHIWEAPLQDGQSKFFLKFFPHYSGNLPDVDEAATEAYTGDECPVYNLPPACNEEFLPYAVSTFDDEEFYGFNCENGIWYTGDIVEMNEPISGLADPTQYECCDGDILRSNGEVAKIDLGFSPENPTSNFDWKPTLKVYLYATYPDLYPTETLVRKFYTAYTASILGVSPILKFKKERDILFTHFTNGGGDELSWKCGSEISKTGFAILPEVVDILDGFELVLKNWLNENDNLEDFFLGQELEIQSVVTAPNLSNPLNLWAFAMMGGTQGRQIEIRKFSKLGNCYEIEVVFTVYDNFGLGLTEKWSIPGIAEQFVLQHFRNEDNTYGCSETEPCFLPVTNHSAEVLKKYIICTD